MDKVVVYRSKRLGQRGQWRWRYVAAGNHKKLANGGESYTRLDDLLDSMVRVLGIDPMVFGDRVWAPGSIGTVYRKGLYDRVRIEIEK